MADFGDTVSTASSFFFQIQSPLQILQVAPGGADVATTEQVIVVELGKKKQSTNR